MVDDEFEHLKNNLKIINAAKIVGNAAVGNINNTININKFL